MKNKILFTVICFLCVALSANAQRDTLQKYPYIYCYNCPETGVYHDSVLCAVRFDFAPGPLCGDSMIHFDDTSIYSFYNSYLSYHLLVEYYAEEFAVYQNSETSLHAVGIAFGFQKYSAFEPSSSPTGSIVLSLYDSTMNARRRIMTEPFICDWPTWYVDSNYQTLTLPGKKDNSIYNLCNWRNPNYDTTLLVLKKVFFDEPIDISEEFYLGFSFYDPYSPDQPYRIAEIPWIFEYHDPPYHFANSKVRVLNDKTWYNGTTKLFPLLFLIIDPDYHGVSGIPEIETPNPTIEIYPNPATEQVEVTSSLPMARIVATDALGHRLLDRPATGLKTTLDVSRWPAGAYLLQVHTATGIASRKLLVQ